MLAEARREKENGGPEQGEACGGDGGERVPVAELVRGVLAAWGASAAALASAVIFSFFTRRSRLPSTVFSPRCTAASETSVIVTS